MLLFILILIFIVVTLLIYALIPVLVKIIAKPLQKIRPKEAGQKSLFKSNKANNKKLIPLIIISPLITAAAGFITFQSPAGAIVGGFFGFFLPSLLASMKEKARKKKFHSQLVDGLMVLSSSLKAGISFLQSIEVLVDEMPAPISEEFEMVIKQNKMGIKIEDSFEQLNKRMPSEDLNLITTAILIARDTGGNLTVIFENLANTIRAKSKIADQIKTLTTQGRWQGIIMSFLPIGFAAFIFKANPEYIEIMLSSQVGRALLIYAVISQIIGIFLINKLTKVEV